MIKKLTKIIDSIKYSNLERFSYILLIFWTISPIIEYILKFFINYGYCNYFVISKYIIGILGILEYILFLYKKGKEDKLNIKNFIPQILILILLIISIISSLHAKDTNLAFFGETYRKEGLIAYIMYIGFILSASIITNKKYIKKLFNIIILSALFITILPLFRSDFTYIIFSNIYHQFNHYGYFLMISSVLTGFMFFNSNNLKKILYLLFFIFLTYMLIKNNTFGCYLALLISLLFSLIYCLIKKHKRIDIIILIVTYIASSFLISHYDIKFGERVNFKDTSGFVLNNFTSLFKDVKTVVNNEEPQNIDAIGTGRGILWKGAWDYTLMHPLLGGGIESLHKYYLENNMGTYGRPHNSILQVSSFIGIPGAIVYILFIVYLGINNLKNLEQDDLNITIYVSTMCYFISSLFGNSMYYTSPYYMILLGLLISINYNSKNNKKSS